jgi:hypothetical protein
MIKIERYLSGMQHVWERREMYITFHLEDLNGKHRELRHKLKGTIETNHKEI